MPNKQWKETETYLEDGALYLLLSCLVKNVVWNHSRKCWLFVVVFVFNLEAIQMEHDVNKGETEKKKVNITRFSCLSLLSALTSLSGNTQEWWDHGFFFFLCVCIWLFQFLSCTSCVISCLHAINCKLQIDKKKVCKNLWNSINFDPQNECMTKTIVS